MKYRLLFDEIIKQVNHKNAIVITGMRQVGKTTLLKQVYEQINTSKIWFDLDNPLDQLLFEDIDYNNIYKNLIRQCGSATGKINVFIDEIQNFPEITKIIKYLIDHYEVKFFVTGSSNYYLKNLFPESLSGRKFLYTLFPLNFKEYLYFHDKISREEAIENNIEKSILSKNIIDDSKYQTYYSSFIDYGGFPEVVSTENEETKKLVLKNIFKSFFEKDLRLLSDYKDIKELRDLILLLVPRVGNILDITKLSGELSINRVKIYSYLEFLQGIFFLKLIPKYSSNISRKVAGGKKVYFADTGLLNIIGKVNDGQLFENVIANQLDIYGDLSFFNKQNTAEIDFILNNKYAFEVKLNGSVNDVYKLKKLSEKLGINQYYIISKKFNNSDNIISPITI